MVGPLDAKASNVFFCPRYQETATAIAYENQGFFEQAQSTYELVS
jgi:hypothetical protein